MEEYDVNVPHVVRNLFPYGYNTENNEADLSYLTQTSETPNSKKIINNEEVKADQKKTSPKVKKNNTQIKSPDDFQKYEPKFNTDTVKSDFEEHLLDISMHSLSENLIKEEEEQNKNENVWFSEEKVQLKKKYKRFLVENDAPEELKISVEEEKSFTVYSENEVLENNLNQILDNEEIKKSSEEREKQLKNKETQQAVTSVDVVETNCEKNMDLNENNNSSKKKSKIKHKEFETDKTQTPIHGEENGSNESLENEQMKISSNKREKKREKKVENKETHETIYSAAEVMKTNMEKSFNLNDEKNNNHKKKNKKKHKEFENDDIQTEVLGDKYATFFSENEVLGKHLDKSLENEEIKNSSKKRGKKKEKEVVNKDTISTTNALETNFEKKFDLNQENNKKKTKKNHKEFENNETQKPIYGKETTVYSENEVLENNLNKSLDNEEIKKSSEEKQRVLNSEETQLAVTTVDVVETNSEKNMDLNEENSNSNKKKSKKKHKKLEINENQTPTHGEEILENEEIKNSSGKKRKKKEKEVGNKDTISTTEVLDANFEKSFDLNEENNNKKKTKKKHKEFENDETQKPIYGKETSTVFSENEVLENNLNKSLYNKEIKKRCKERQKVFKNKETQQAVTSADVFETNSENMDLNEANNNSNKKKSKKKHKIFENDEVQKPTHGEENFTIYSKNSFDESLENEQIKISGNKRAKKKEKVFVNKETQDTIYSTTEVLETPMEKSFDLDKENNSSKKKNKKKHKEFENNEIQTATNGVKFATFFSENEVLDNHLNKSLENKEIKKREKKKEKEVVNKKTISTNVLETNFEKSFDLNEENDNKKKIKKKHEEFENYLTQKPIYEGEIKAFETDLDQILNRVKSSKKERKPRKINNNKEKRERKKRTKKDMIIKNSTGETTEVENTLKRQKPSNSLQSKSNIEEESDSTDSHNSLIKLLIPEEDTNTNKITKSRNLNDSEENINILNSLMNDILHGKNIVSPVNKETKYSNNSDPLERKRGYDKDEESPAKMHKKNGKKEPLEQTYKSKEFIEESDSDQDENNHATKINSEEENITSPSNEERKYSNNSDLSEKKRSRGEDEELPAKKHKKNGKKEPLEQTYKSKEFIEESDSDQDENNHATKINSEVENIDPPSNGKTKYSSNSDLSEKKRSYNEEELPAKKHKKNGKKEPLEQTYKSKEFIDESDSDLEENNHATKINNEVSNIDPPSNGKTKYKSYSGEDLPAKKHMKDFKIASLEQKYKSKEFIDESDSELEENNHASKINNEVRGNTFEEDSDDDKDSDFEFDRNRRMSFYKTQDLHNMTIHLPFDVPRLHSILNRSTRPTPEQTKLIRDLGVKIKTGIFSKEEDKLIKKNWERFYTLHDLGSDPTLFMNVNKLKMGSQKKKFLQFLAHGLDNRLLHRVYKRFQILYRNPLQTGRFTEKEDQIIREHTKTSKSSTPILDLARMLNRDKGAIEKRCEFLERKEKSKTINKTIRYWNLKLMTRLVDVMKEVLKCEDVNYLKNRDISIKKWKKIAKKMEYTEMDFFKFRRAWTFNIHARLFGTMEKSRYEVIPRIVTIIKNNNFKEWRELHWRDIALEFNVDCYTSNVLYYRFKTFVTNHVPTEYQNDLKGCMQYLLDMRYDKTIPQSIFIKTYSKLDINLFNKKEERK